MDRSFSTVKICSQILQNIANILKLSLATRHSALDHFHFYCVNVMRSLIHGSSLIVAIGINGSG